MFRDLGYNGVIDSNDSGIIHNNEPTQAVFFSKTSIHTLELLRNISPSAPLSTIDIWIRQPKALLALLQSGRMTDDELASIVKNNPKLLGTLLNSELSPELRSRIRQLTTATVIDTDGTQAWYQNGEFHRLDGPAIIDADGTQEWWQNERHRLDGPAVIRANGTQEWYQNGERHRLDGPAVMGIFGCSPFLLTCVIRKIHPFLPTKVLLGRLGLLHDGRKRTIDESQQVVIVSRVDVNIFRAGDKQSIDSDRLNAAAADPTTGDQTLGVGVARNACLAIDETAILARNLQLQQIRVVGGDQSNLAGSIHGVLRPATKSMQTDPLGSPSTTLLMARTPSSGCVSTTPYRALSDRTKLSHGRACGAGRGFIPVRGEHGSQRRCVSRIHHSRRVSVFADRYCVAR